MYLKRYAYPPVLDYQKPPSDLRLVVTIPSFKEQGLADSLRSLADCLPAKHSVHVIVAINQPEGSSPDINELTETSYHKALALVERASRPGLSFSLIRIDLPKDHAGVGLARKIAMDEAVRLLESLRPEFPKIHEEAVIACYDADCLCDRNYLRAIEDHYLQQPGCPGATVYYEHPLEGKLGACIYEGAVKYELFLRYHVNALRFAAFPYAYQTVGSCITVRSSIYQKQGGMNRRQAGEDFYFLQKLFPLKGFSEINSTRVLPSPRISDRVPFGTGKAISTYLAGDGDLMAYNPSCYKDLKAFLSLWEIIYAEKRTPDSLSRSISEFLELNHFQNSLEEMLDSSRSSSVFYKKFFHWFNGFRALKFIHFARDHYYPSIRIEDASNWLLYEYLNVKGIATTAKEALELLRKKDREGPKLKNPSL